jgi:hypothetical protein
MRTWLCYGLPTSVDADGNPMFSLLRSSYRQARFAYPSNTIYEVEVEEVETGPLKAWVDVGTNNISAINRAGIFEIAFPDGSKDKEDKGLGKAIFLTVKSYRVYE